MVMIINTLNYQKVVEDRLQLIKKHKLDIMILQRQNEELCKENNQKINGLNESIINLEQEIKNLLTESEQKKIDTSVGYASFRVMPDKWIYDDKKIIDWCENNDLPYYKIEKILKKQELKKAIESGNIEADTVEGLQIEKQEPKFGYKLKEII